MFAVALWMSALTALAGARVYDRCELARDLQLLGVERDHIATWVCIAFHESRFDTAAQNYGSGDHGLLQISELYWCGPGKACGAPCSAFRDEDISDDVKCALQIHREHTRLQGDGFLAWVVYPHHCKQNAKKFIIDCDKNAKNFPVKFDNKARYLKPTDIRPEPRTQVVNVPYRNSQGPRYLAINSIFQGSYVDEFERNYYDNNKQSNWLYFKVDNIDDLKLPGADATRSRFTELTTRPTTTIPLDPALKGIKPPSPKRIETNQFRRRKTFAEPLFLRNRIADDQKIIRTTPVPVREETDSKFSFNEDLSHNIFLNLPASIISTSLREFSPQEKQSDFRQFHVKTPRVESISPNSIITYDDLAQNPFLNSLLGFNYKYRVDSPFLVTDSSQKVRYTSPSPVSLVTSSKQVKSLPEQDSKIQENDDIKVSIEDLSKNPFLGHLLRANIGTLSAESQHPLNRGENLRRGFTLTTSKPLRSTQKEDLESGNIRLETSTTIPKSSVQRGRTRFQSDFDKKPTENPTTERSTTVAYSTRKYQTISRQRSNINTNDFKSTTAIEQNTEKSDISSTVKPNDNNYRRPFRIETTTSKSTTLYNGTQDKYAFGLINAGILQTTSRQTTRRPETTKINSISRIQTTSRPQITNSIKTTSTTSRSTSQTTSMPVILSGSSTTSRQKPPSTQKTTQRSDTVRTISLSRSQSTSGQTTTSPETTSAPLITSRPWKTIGQETKQKPETVKQNSLNRLQTTSRPQSTGKPEITSAPLTTSRPWKTIGQETTQKPETVKQNSLNRLQTTSRPQTTGKPEITSAPLTTTRPWKTIRQQTTQRPETAKLSFISIAQTTSRPKTIGRLEKTNAPLTTSAPWKTIIVQQTTQRPETTKPNAISRLQDTSTLQTISRPEQTSEPLTTNRPWKTIGQQTQRPEIAKSNFKSILQATSRPQTNGRPEVMSSPQTTSRPWKTIGQQSTQRPETSKSNFISRLQTTAITTSRPAITSVPLTTSKPGKPIRQQTTKSPETAKTNYISRIQITSRPQTTIGPPTTSRPQVRSRPETTSKPEAKNRRVQTTSNATTIGLQTSRPWVTSTPKTTSSTTVSRSINRFGEDSRTYASTTSQPGSSWRKYTNSTISPTTSYTTIKPTVVSTTEASKGRTTQSIFDLYLKPSTRPSFKPFEFTTSINRPSKLSIFSGGTTKPHPDYFTTKKPFT